LELFIKLSDLPCLIDHNKSISEKVLPEDVAQ
jgi:TATA-binding protein-associated factor Taf7